MQVKNFSILGSYLADNDDGRAGYYDGADLIVTTDQDTQHIVGFRTFWYLNEFGLLKNEDRGEDPEWTDGYVPLPTTLRNADIYSFNFQEVMWLDAEPGPCLFWSNNAMNERAISSLWSNGQGKVLESGLPSPAEMGIEVPLGLVSHAVPARVEAGSVDALGFQEPVLSTVNTGIQGEN